MDEIKIELKNGFQCTIDPEDMDDYELFEQVAEIDAGNKTLVPAVVRRLIGAEKHNELKEYVRKDGKVSATAMMEQIAEIFEQIRESKKK